MFKYSIIIPTYNRCDLLRRCLDNICLLSDSIDEFEVLIIDNGSKDNTKTIVESFLNQIPNLRYFYDATPGLHVGRHLGAKEAKGEILCYLDDDSFVDKEWLIGIEKAFNNPNVVIAGGPNIPEYEEAPPSWLKYFWEKTPFGNYISQLSLLDMGNEEKFVPLCYVFGCNFNIKKEILYKYGGFNPDGMPSELLKFRGDGETGLCAKLNAEGYKAYYSPRVRIKHFVPKSRMTEVYFKKRAFMQGISDAFTQIRMEKGIYNPEDFNFMKNFSIHKWIKESYFSKICKNFDPSYRKFLKIQQNYIKSFEEGKHFLYETLQKEPEHLKYVLKETYL